MSEGQIDWAQITKGSLKVFSKIYGQRCSCSAPLWSPLRLHTTHSSCSALPVCPRLINDIPIKKITSQRDHQYHQVSQTHQARIPQQSEECYYFIILFCLHNLFSMVWCRYIDGKIHFNNSPWHYWVSLQVQKHICTCTSVISLQGVIGFLKDTWHVGLRGLGWNQNYK